LARLVRDTFEGIKKEFSEYWRKRFHANVDAYSRTLGRQRGYQGSYADQSPETQLYFVREYFWAISAGMPQLAKDELTRRVAPQ
jgi:hypothetical protein